MAKVIVGMTTSLDGFVADESGSVARLYADLGALGGGLRFFENTDLNVKLEKVGVQEIGPGTSLRFRGKM